MLIYLLLAIFIAMLYITYTKFDKDIVAPAFVLVSGYTFSIICAIANVDAWKIDLHWQTVGVLTYGTGLFVITGYLVKRYMQKRYEKENHEEKVLVPIQYNKKYVKYFCVFQIVVMALWIANIYYVTSQLGDFNSFSEMMVAFRNWSSYSTEWIGSKLYFVINQFAQICGASVPVFTYLFTYNYVVKNTVREDALSVLPFGLSVGLMLLGGGRLGILQFVMCFCMLVIFFRRKINKKIFLLKLKVVVMMIASIILGSVLFYYAKALVGRGASNLSTAHIFSYITMYVGGPIQLLDMFLQNPIESSLIWGKETFYTIILQLSRLGIIDVQPYIIHLEFRNALTGAFLGNIYTAYRSYIYDFGNLGLTVLPIIFACCVSFLYYKVLYDKKIKAYSIWILLYMLVFPSIFFDFVRCFFFASVISFATVKKMIFIVGLSCAFVKEFKLKDVFSK